MFSKTDIQSNIQTALTPRLEHFGFTPIKHPKKLQYKKSFNGGFQSCTFSIMRREQTFWIEMSVGVRIDIVERIANQFTLILKDFQDESHTVQSTYGRIMGQPYFRFKVENMEELEVACEKMEGFLEEIGLDFMQDNSQIRAIDRLINRHPEKPSRFIYNESHRCIKGVIVAQMARNPHLKSLIQAYQIVLQRHSLGDRMLPQYLKLVKYLDVFSVN